jgi:hypothetical protein
MGSHEVVNGANGSVTWCSGLGCPRCDADRELNQRLRRREPAIRLGGNAMPPWGYQIIGVGYPLGYRVVG